ncbi:hypothetical protein GOP47_0010241 [Adiantum capillus-veneris]|uniref:Protein kinase domain-containing protein n=1 Tax=Adiantum capillus-veneris TaxID=13818 RepID=A0A9D4UUC5_ADICA|nr:hypothetical protein GOP47_0010241 [Adiantum capillus-veneris]
MIGLLENLFWLDLAQNQLSGPLPYSSDGKSDVNAGFDNVTKAGHFHLNNNSFSGAIPASICHSGMSLVHLLLDSNRLTGSIPGELGQCENLLIMKLNNNQLQGAVPDEIGQLINITLLQLNDNQLVGPLPDLSNLTKLGVLLTIISLHDYEVMCVYIKDLSNNLIDEDFPPWMSSLESLTDLSMISSSSIKGQIPPSFFALPDLRFVKLANNHISGTLDMSRATHRFSLVSMEKNNISNIELVSAKTNSEVLGLQGNPVCDEGSLLFYQKVCSDNSALSTPTSYGTDTSCSKTCPSGYQVKPAQCTCAVSYQGILTYRAPMFLSLRNDSVQVLAAALAANLSVDQKQVVIPSAAFNAQNQLLVVIAIFPSGTAIRWDRDDVLRMATILGKDVVSPPGFGPPMFQQYPVNFPAEGSGLSTGAKIGITAGSAALLLIVLTVICFACLQKRRAYEAVELSKPFASWGAGGAESGSMPKLKGARFFPYAELKKATNNFSESNEIGSGGYGKVYRGILSSGEQVAIKRAQGNSMQGASEFKTEIELLSRVHHKNVVGLVGFCIEQGEQMLVYEYMAGGSLRVCLTVRTLIGSVRT